MKRFFVAAVCLTVFLSTHALAQTEDAGRACKGDIEKFCKDVKPGGGEIIKCLMEHKDELSDACRKELALARKKMAEKKKEQPTDVCAEDVKKFCKDVKPGEGRIINCLKEHASELSPQCREKLQSSKAK